MTKSKCCGAIEPTYKWVCNLPKGHTGLHDHVDEMTLIFQPDTEYCSQRARSNCMNEKNYELSKGAINDIAPKIAAILTPTLSEQELTEKLKWKGWEEVVTNERERIFVERDKHTLLNGLAYDVHLSDWYKALKPQQGDHSAKK